MKNFVSGNTSYTGAKSMTALIYLYNIISKDYEKFWIVITEDFKYGTDRKIIFSGKQALDI